MMSSGVKLTTIQDLQDICYFINFHVSLIWHPKLTKELCLIFLFTKIKKLGFIRLNSRFNTVEP